ncbi:MAG: hypothetical protein IJW53_03120 [Clostridia bacterium]|nr:hypothetical protein [Clostridia bacterium]
MVTKTKKILRNLVSFVLIAATIFSLVACKKDDEEDDNNNGYDVMADPVDDNYRTFYQIFVGSFSDGTRDGIGDLQGIINRFDYLNDGNVNSDTSLGVQGIWLSPIFSSPSYHKYDVKDYYQIDWRFGTEETLKSLIDLCHERNVKIILDLVINHTSSQHPWFLAFKEARMNSDEENKYYDYYTAVTTEEKVSGRTYQKIAGVDCWYECNFSGDMPELNFDNPEVKEEMLKVAEYYLNLGVDGFRFDAVKYIYFGDTVNTVKFWEWYMSELKKIKSDIYCVGECWSGETEILSYYTAMNCFNFAMSQAEGVAASAAKGKSLVNFTHYVESYQQKVRAANPEGMEMSFLSNHDMDRIAGAFVVETYNRMAANLYLLSPGSPFIYYGEEIGIRGSRGSANTDANRRLAMLWGDDDLVKDPVGTTYSKDKQITTTVADQMEDENSLYRYYCKLLSIRHRYPAIARGTYTALDSSDKNLGGFLVEYEGEKIGIIHNNSAEEISYDLAKCTDLSGHMFTEILEAIGSGSAKLEGTVLTVGAYTSIILK